MLDLLYIIIDLSVNINYLRLMACISNYNVHNIMLAIFTLHFTRIYTLHSLLLCIYCFCSPSTLPLCFIAFCLLSVCSLLAFIRVYLFAKRGVLQVRDQWSDVADANVSSWSVKYTNISKACSTRGDNFAATSLKILVLFQFKTITRIFILSIVFQTYASCDGCGILCN